MAIKILLFFNTVLNSFFLSLSQPFKIMIMSPLLKRILKSKITWIVVIFGVWMVFFDQNSLIRQISLSRELNKAQKQEQYYRKEIAKDSLQLEKLKTDDKEVEKLAREKYMMKKDDEKIFLIVREDEEKK